jgi:hypothetical protein
MPTKIKPALYAGPFGWGWVFLPELAEMMNLDPVTVWDSFLDVAEPDEQGKPVLNWTEDSVIARVAGMDEALNRSEELYVAAGWALSVLELWNSGALSVRQERHRHQSGGSFCPLAGYVLHPCRPNQEAGLGHFVAPIAVGTDGYPVKP